MFLFFFTLAHRKKLKRVGEMLLWLLVDVVVVVFQITSSPAAGQDDQILSQTLVAIDSSSDPSYNVLLHVCMFSAQGNKNTALNFLLSVVPPAGTRPTYTEINV